MMEQVRLCTVWPMENWLGTSKTIYRVGWLIWICYSRAVERRCLSLSFPSALMNVELWSRRGQESRLSETIFFRARAPLRLKVMDDIRMRRCSAACSTEWIGSNILCSHPRSIYFINILIPTVDRSNFESEVTLYPYTFTNRMSILYNIHGQ